MSGKGRPRLRRLAIANRGEAAMRCIRAVESLRECEGSDLESLVVYTDVERNAPFVHEADVAVHIPADAGREAAAYLNGDLLVESFVTNGADAVWPGWGFLAENADFADAVAAAGLTFLGPPASVLRRAADKVAAKAIAEAGSIPVIPWSGGPVRSLAEAESWGGRLGYPLMVKAVAGGGGRGIRRVASPDELAAAFEWAGREALAAFGDDRVFLERQIDEGRHLEVQVVADLHGHVLALGLRDCSVQRRHQKVIEEAPPPGLAPGLAAAMEGAAVALAADVGYVGVGTVEFLVRGGAFYFLEMNPRLQVEHAVTECVVNLDLVELQIRIARGESIAGLRVQEQGHAIEARLCAEDPSEEFAPTSGSLALYEPPLGSGIRVETGARVGCVVPAAFDSLIAKVIGFGDSRREARARLLSALKRFDVVIDGGATNRRFLTDVLDSRAFQEGGVDTEWLGRWHATRSEDGRFRAEALMAASIVTYEEERSRAINSLTVRPDGVRLPEVLLPRPRDIALSEGTFRHRIRTWATGHSRYRLRMGEHVVCAHFVRDGPRTAVLRLGSRHLRVLYQVGPAGIRVEIDGAPYRFSFRGAEHVVASIHAVIVALDCHQGDLLEVGQVVAVLEAMKAEIRLCAPVAGVVREVRVRKGQTVEPGQLMIEIEPAGTAAGGDGVACSPAPTQSRSVDVIPALPTSPVALDSELVAVLADEIRSAALGFDVDPERAARIVSLLKQAPVGSETESANLRLAEFRRLMTVLVDVQGLFQRTPRLRADGSVGPSNHARLLSYLHQRGAALGPDSGPSHRLVHRALAHHGVAPDDPLDRRQEALVRLLASQDSSELWEAMMCAVLSYVRRQARRGLDLSADPALDNALFRLGGLRGAVSDGLADDAVSARAEIFDSGRLKQEIERLRKQVDRWLEGSDLQRVPPLELLEDVASAADRVFREVRLGPAEVDERRAAWALAARICRNHSPSGRLIRIDRLDPAGSALDLEFASGTRVAASIATSTDLSSAAAHVWEAAIRRDPGARWTIEILDAEERTLPEERFRSLRTWLASADGGTPVTVCILNDCGEEEYVTFCRTSGKDAAALPLHGLHPAVAERIDFSSLSAFELRRLPRSGDAYGFWIRDSDDPSEERIILLAEVRGGSRPRHVARAFERAFLEARGSLLTWLPGRTAGRGAAAHEMSFFVTGVPNPHSAVIGRLARRLMPTTRALGVDTLRVRLRPRGGAGGDPTRCFEIVIADPAGGEVLMHGPHSESVASRQPAAPEIVRTRRRGLMHPSDLIRFLTSGNAPRTTPLANGLERLPPATFAEWDLVPDGAAPVAQCSPGGARPRSSVVFGIISTPTLKVPEGMRRVLVISDPSLEMGSLGPAECERIIAAIDMAERLSVPVEWIPVSSGARISMESGTENLDATARVARRIVTFTQSGGVIHVIVNGLNVGAQSYFDALSTMLGHTRGALIMTPKGAMVLTGKAALEASGGVAGADEFAMGGFDAVMGPNGEAHYQAWNLADAYRLLYEHYRYTYVVPGERSPRQNPSEDPPDRVVTRGAYGAEDGLGFRLVGDIFEDAHNPGRKRPFSMRALMSAVVDADGGHLERWRLWDGAETAIVWDAHLGGIAATLVGIESRGIRRSGSRALDGPEEWTGGTLFPRSSKKIARALNAASGNRPVAILANLAGFDGSPESMRELQLEFGAEIIRAVVNFQGPIVFLVVSRYHGGAYVVFSRELNPGLRAAALEGSYASVIGGSAAAAVIFAKDVRRRTEEDAAVARAREAVRGPDDLAELERVRAAVYAEKERDIAREFDSIHTIERARSVGSLEHVVPADALRPFLIQLLRSPTSAQP